MGFLNKIKRIMQGFKKNKETDFVDSHGLTPVALKK
jgi:hypothetical protein